MKASSPAFLVPEFHADLSNETILAMTYVEGVPIESLATAPQAERDRIMTLQIDLVLRELFEFNLMQTDPNFANYRYNAESKKLVLLDFGATRALPASLATDYARLARAGLAGDRASAQAAIVDIGYFDARTKKKHQDKVMDMFELALEPLRTDGLFDFGKNDLSARLRDEGMAMAADRDFWHIPPVDTIFLQRKFGGVYLLASKLKARVDVRGLLDKHLAGMG
jgi:predicted unusual protein kinase regulating ubiquinone biosynthesis (AarF/ABC1/UbiB family)